MQANIKKKKQEKSLLIMYIYGATGFFFWQQSQFLIDKPSITFLIAFHFFFLI